MANYTPYFRSNYFAVKDEAVFREFADRFGLKLIEKETPECKLFGFLQDEADESGIPTYDHEADEETNFPALVAEHLAPGWVAEVREIGYEKMCYLTGYAFAVNSQGEVVQINLDDLSDKAKHLGR